MAACRSKYCFVAAGFKIKGDEHEWILRRSKRNAKERRFFRCDSHARPASKWFDYPTTPLEEARKIPNTVKFEDDSNMAIPQFGKECKIRGVGLDYKVRIMIARPYGPREDITDIVFHAPSGMWYNANICRAMDRNLLWGSQGPDGVPLVGVDEGNKDDDDEDEDDDKTKEITTCDEEAQEKGGQDAPFMEWELRM